MTHPIPEPTPRHRQIIATALEDWWVTADPAAPFNPAEVAEQVDTYLLGSGYTIGVRMKIPTPPSRAHITFTAFLALACLLGTAAAVARQNWALAVPAFIGSGVYLYELKAELAERRRGSRT